MTVTHFVKEVNNLQVGFLQNGVENPDSTVIFIHGFPFDKELWVSQLEHLPPGVRGIAYDVRGFGESPSGHGFFSIDLFASDLISLIKNLGVNKVTVCGLSMGGYIIFRAYEKAPELFSGIILADTNASADNNETRLNRFSTIETIQKGDKKTFTEQFLKKVLCEKTLIEKEDKVSWLRTMVMTVSSKTLCATQLALASRTDTIHVLNLMNLPVLILRGEEDQLMIKEQAAFLHKNIANSQLVEIPASGHLPNIENPEGFNQAINNFLELV